MTTHRRSGGRRRRRPERRQGHDRGRAPELPRQDRPVQPLRPVPHRRLASVARPRRSSESSFTANGPGLVQDRTAVDADQARHLPVPGDGARRREPRRLHDAVQRSRPSAAGRPRPTDACTRVVSAQTVGARRASITDRVTVSGLARRAGHGAGSACTAPSLRVTRSPAPARPSWTGTIEVTADGTFQTEAVTLSRRPATTRTTSRSRRAEFVARGEDSVCRHRGDDDRAPASRSCRRGSARSRRSPGGTITRQGRRHRYSAVLSLSVQVVLCTGPSRRAARSRARGRRYWTGHRSSRRATGRTRPRRCKLEQGRLLHVPRDDCCDRRRRARRATTCAETAETTFVVRRSRR